MNKDIFLSSQFKRMLETHKRCSLWAFYQLFEFSNLHRRTLDGQEGQDRSEEALLHKSRGLTCLLDQDRERFVQQTLEGPMYFQMPTFHSPLE